MSEAPEVEAIDPDAETVEQSEPVETKAQRLGWRPKEEFKGDETKWIDAAEFVKRGEEILPFVQANNKALERSLTEANKQIAKLQTTFKEFGEHHTKTVKAQYERALNDLKAEQAQAAAAGDVEAVQRTTEAIVDLGKEVRTDAPDLGADEAKRAHAKFTADNPWFGTDKVMTAAARAIGDQLVEEGVTDPDEQIAEIAKRVKAEFPHKFENPNRRLPGAVEGGTPARRTAGKTFSDLPAEAKATALRFEKAGIMKRDEYVKDYDWTAK